VQKTKDREIIACAKQQFFSKNKYCVTVLEMLCESITWNRNTFKNNGNNSNNNNNNNNNTC
jgi:hypothetical protein